MKTQLVVAAILLCNLSLWAQTDSAGQKVNAVEQKVDSLNRLIPTQLPALPDSLLPGYVKLDSIRKDFNSKSDSLVRAYHKTIAGIDSQTYKLQRKLDSLQQRALPKTKLEGKLDSLQQLRAKAQADVTSNLDKLKASTSGKLQKLDLPAQYGEPINQLSSSVNGFGVNGDFAMLPQPQVPGFSLPETKNMTNLSAKAGDFGNLGSIKEQISSIDTPVGDVGALTDRVGEVGEQVKGIQEDVKHVTSGNLDEVKELPNMAEQQIAKLDEVQALQKADGSMKENLAAMQDGEAAKQHMIEKAQELAVDHFANQKGALNDAVGKIAAYKQKYSSIKGLQDLARKPPNPMKDKPFIERLIPGLYFQYQRWNYNLFDFNPYLGYKLGGRISAGLGWNQRLAYDPKQDAWKPEAKNFGPRAYVDVQLGRGFIAHTEGETMNTFVPTALNRKTDGGQREWVWGMMMGLKKEYKIYKNLQGTILLQYNFFDSKHKAPYVDRINSRIGIEYNIQKITPKPKKEKKQ